jgi:hypothetical protein
LTAALLALCAGVLPGVWPGNLAAYVLIFLASFTTISVVATRLLAVDARLKRRPTGDPES